MQHISQNNNQYQSKLKIVFKDIKDAIAGSEQDYTSGSMKKAIFLLSIPMVLEMIMESVFAIVDIYFVSKISTQAVTTVGLTESLLVAVIFTIGMGYAMATTALISRRVGEKKYEEASKVAVQAIILGVVTSIVLAIPGVFYASDLLRIMGAEKDIVENMSTYTAIMFGGNGIIMLLFIINAVFRGAGDAAVAMRVLWLANGINIILDPLLIFGIGPFPKLGVEGAAIATTIGRGLAVIYQIYLLFNGKHRIKLTLAAFKVDFSIIGQLVKLSLGTIGQYFIATASWLGLARILSTFGSDVFAGYQIAIRVFIFSLLPSWGISNAAATLVGQNLGANNPDRAEKTVWMVAKVNMITMAIVMVFFLTIPELLIKMFTTDAIVVASGSQCLRIMGLGLIFYGLGMVMINSFNGAGDTFTPTWINVIAFWAIEIPLAWFLALHSGLNEIGVFIAIVVAETVMTIIALMIFRQGKWKLKKV
ncbi:MAG: MATE family efflux transporter [Bacteroidetes bacterium]|jgi:putative MATE family efflux protein|nr:MATE family efflux transporter [Bacteroidota bacterium]MBT4729669.1 MATE family efflux transporter [Bacteroidota bacterium]MBT5992078.1 MATE family efflux transporter [Bacteroidota bacterium]MBT7996287.1 MATE family efflux transporter [Bacteroidota bacterium]